jgi:hypothetical protein
MGSGSQRPLGQKQNFLLLVKPEKFFHPNADGEPKQVLWFQAGMPAENS